MEEKSTLSDVFTFTRRSSDSFPDEVMAFAARLLVDTIGVAAGSAGMDAGRIASDFASQQFCAPKENAVPIMFDGRLVSTAGAAFAAASSIDNLDAHDGYNPTLGHIGCAIVPALFAWGTKIPNLTGRDALAAFIVGYEIAARAAITLHATVSDYHTSGAWNGLGVVALGARLHGADLNTMRQALGIAEYHGPRSQMMREIANPTMLHDGSGMGALTGVMAYEMADQGFTGAPALTIEAADAVRYWKDLGTLWTVPLNYIKPYPICRWAHGALDAVHALKSAYEFTTSDIKSMDVRTFEQSSKLFTGMPDTTSKAQYSLAFSLATLARFGTIGVNHITGDALSDPVTSDLVDCISIEEDERHSKRFPAGRWSDVTITLKDGTVLKSGDVNARGGPEAPLSDAELREKYDGLCSSTLSPDRANAIWETGFGLINQDAKFADLSKLVLRKTDN